MASEIRYATEENIRTLIELINSKLAEYSTSEKVEKDIDTKLKAYLESSEFKKAVKDIVGDVSTGTPPSTTPDDPDEEDYSNYLKYKIDFNLPEEGEPNTLYFIVNPETDMESQNRYDEYMWLPGTGFELMGSIGSDGGGMTYEVVFVLPDQGESNKIYLVPKTAEGDNRCDEYIWLEDQERFELLGPTGLFPLSVEKVDELPQFGLGNVLYLVSKDETDSGIYNAYLWSDKTDEDSPMKVDTLDSDLPEAPDLDLGHFEFIGAIGFDPIFATEEDIDPLYNFLIKPNLTKEVSTEPIGDSDFEPFEPFE